MSTADAPPLVSVTDLSFGYDRRPDSPLVLKNVSFALHESEIVTITGPSGSGKTTLLSVIGLLLRVPPGFVRIGDIDVGAASESEIIALRRRIRFVFQRSYLLSSLTVLQNIIASLIIDKTSDAAWNVKRAAEFLGHFGLGDHMHKWPEQLSGGQQQRVAVARALVGLPEILLADEPTASLDRDTAMTVIEKIRDIAQKLGCGVVLATHDERISSFATRRLMMVDGVLVDQSS